MSRIFMLALLVLSGCGSSSGNQSSDVCSAILRLDGNGADFKTMSTAEKAEDAFAALDRMSQRTRDAIAALQAIEGNVGAEAERLATVEQGLLPILDQFRNAQDQQGWTAARDAYGRWYGQSTQVITNTVANLEKLGVHCG
jgi:hypothetical protein